jgi:hypothetical protein
LARAPEEADVTSSNPRYDGFVQALSISTPFPPIPGFPSNTSRSFVVEWNVQIDGALLAALPQFLVSVTPAGNV